VIRPGPSQQVSGTLGDMPGPTPQEHTRRPRRTPPHACPACHELWAVRGARHPSGAWIFVCRACDWKQVLVVKDRRSRPRQHA
jgi:hypothetical protein